MCPKLTDTTYHRTSRTSYGGSVVLTSDVLKAVMLVLNELYFWTLSIVWCLKKLRNKIYIPKNQFFETPDDG
jgi:hypothetical protein